MKNLKKLMSVVLTVAMLMSMIVSTSAATFTDVAETDKAYEAIEVLAALDILEGKEEGNFDPEANIKRSEFAAVICRTMNAEAAASGSTANFTDVAANHWAAGYIGWAAGSGIVNGKGAGIFDPDANVTYQEAVTMIVRAMGFEPLAIKRGGFPTGYMAIANTYGITNGVAMTPANGAATRAGVAQLVYNAFDAPLMDASFITLSDDDEYQIYDGSKYALTGVERRTLLSQYNDIYKVKATVANTYRSDAANLIKSNGDMLIELKLVANNAGLYKFPAAQIAAVFNFTVAQMDGTNSFKALCDDTTVASLLGYTVNAYITVDENGEIDLLAIVPDMKSIETITFDAPKTDIQNITVASASASPVPYDVDFSYWENDKLKDAKFATADAVEVYVNGVSQGYLNGFSEATLYDGTYSSVTLLGAKGDKFTKILATKYDYAMVESVDTELMTITTDQGELTLNEDDVREEFIYTITKDGAAIELADIAEGDILNIISDDASDFTNAYFADIIVSDEVIESSVYQIDGDTGAYTIDGAEYLLANGAAVSSLNAGDAGLFYLTVDGYIYDAELSKGFSGNYAFVVDMALDASSFGQKWQIKMLTKDNTIATYDVKSTVKVNGTSKKIDACTGSVDSCEQCAALANLYAAVVTNPVDTTANERLITYTLSGDEITSINFAAVRTASNARDYNYKSLDNDVTSTASPLPTLAPATYNSKTDRLGGYNLLSGTVVFNAEYEAIPSASAAPYYRVDENKVQVYTISSLDEEIADYNGFVFDIDADKAIGAALITNSMGFAGSANALAVVKSVSTGLDAAGNSTDIINFFQAGNMKSLPVTNDAYLGGAYSLSAGDIIQYTTNAADEINNMEVVFDMEENSAPSASPVTVAYDGGVVNAARDFGTVAYHVGVVEGVTAKSLDLANGASFGWDLDENGTNVLFDVTKASASVSSAFAGKSGVGYIKAAKNDGTNYTTDVYVVVVKEDDGVVTEVVTYKYAKGTAYAGFAAKFTKA